MRIAVVSMSPEIIMTVWVMTFIPERPHVGSDAVLLKNSPTVTTIRGRDIIMKSPIAITSGFKLSAAFFIISSRFTMSAWSMMIPMATNT